VSYTWKAQQDILAFDAKQINSRVNLKPLLEQTILITGASGLLGLHFLASMREFWISQKNRGLKVYAVVHSRPEELLENWASEGWLEILRMDLSDGQSTKKLPVVDIVIHAAGYGQPGRFTADPFKTLAINTAATLELFNHVKPGGKFLFTSSAEVYTGLTNPPFKENQVGTTDPSHPRACYIEGKRSGEALCHSARTRGVDAKAARIALTYGPGTRADDTRVLNMFIQKGLNGRIDLQDDGSARRSFLYATDAIVMIWNILLHGHAVVFNVGGLEELSILELSEMIGSILHVPVQAKEQKGLSGAPVVVRLNIEQYTEEFGSIDFVPLRNGIETTIAWQRLLYE
jgi:nucleoside-diphosphate-sugar epimerase